MLCALLALYFGRARTLSYADGCEIVSALKQLPELAKQTLKLTEQVQKLPKNTRTMKTACSLAGR